MRFTTKMEHYSENLLFDFQSKSTELSKWYWKTKDNKEEGGIKRLRRKESVIIAAFIFNNKEIKILTKKPFNGNQHRANTTTTVIIILIICKTQLCLVFYSYFHYHCKENLNIKTFYFFYSKENVLPSNFTDSLV